MSEQYVAAIDQGTTSTRCMIFNQAGRVVDVDQKEHEQIFPRAGWVEHNADRDLEQHPRGRRPARSRRPTSRQGHRRGRASRTSARPRWCGTGPPASRSTTPSSGRTPAPTPSAKQLGDLGGGAERYKDKVGLPLATYFSGPKVALDPRQRRRRPGEGRGRRPGVRQHGHLGASGT